LPEREVLGERRCPEVKTPLRDSGAHNDDDEDRRVEIPQREVLKTHEQPPPQNVVPRPLFPQLPKVSSTYFSPLYFIPMASKKQ
jgi:hypothetical protein